MASLQHCAAFSKQRPHALTVAQCRAFFDAIFGPFGGAPEHAEHRRIAAKFNRVIPPVSSSNHPAVEIQDLREFILVEANLIVSANPGKGRNDRAQLAVLPLARRGLAGETLL